MKKADAVLGPMLKRLGIESGVRLERIRKDWFALFEPTLTSHMYPAGCTEKELLINVDSPAWMQQFTYARNDILKKLSPYGIADLRFRIGRVRQQKSHKPHSGRQLPLSPDDAAFAAATVAHLDAGLRESVRRAMERSLRAPRKSSGSAD